MNVFVFSRVGMLEVLDNGRRGCARPRRGQALLLAVLLMLFVALLGATFVTVVALNLQQTARGEDKTRAQNAAQAGLRFVNNQLTNSPDGPQWFVAESRRAANMSAPATADMALAQLATNSLYYTGFDRAKGWTGKFLKFPNPLAPQASDTPTFLARVDVIGGNDADNPKNPNGSDGPKTGDFRITIIGLSPDDSGAFDRLTAYKAGPLHSPFGGAMRVSTLNYLAGKAAPEGRVDTVAANVVTISDVKGRFPSVPFMINVGGLNLNTSASLPIEPALVVGIDYPTAGSAQLTLMTPLSAVPASGVRVAAAANYGVGGPLQTAAPNFGAVQRVDFFNTNITDSSQPNAALRAMLNVSGDDNETLSYNDPIMTTTPGSIWSTGDIAFSGNVFSLGLRDPSTATVAKPVGFLRSAGLVSAPAVSKDTNNKQISGVGIEGASEGNTLTGSLVSSNNSRFPGTTGAPKRETDAVITDGFNRILNNTTDPVRQTRAFVPPDFVQGGRSDGRYKQLTQFSPPRQASFPAEASSHGYGEGIYLGNDGDREKIFDGGTLREMRQDELMRLWALPSDPTGTSLPASASLASCLRDSANAVNDASDVASSLEQKHLRGWVSAQEFRPRGALIEIQIDSANPANSTIAITRDSRADNLPAAISTDPNRQRSLGPVSDQAWKDANGNVMPGVYREVFPWPVNGTIFAEGNVRVRGGVPNPDNPSIPAQRRVHPPSSLTIVSMGNIYIEGSINAGGTESAAYPGDDPAKNRKLLLLARKNVVCNPTALVQQTDEQTTLTTAATASTTIEVADASAFRPGDVLAIGDAPTVVYARIASGVGAINLTTPTTPDVITLTTNVTTSGQAVRTVGDRDNANDALTLLSYNANRSMLRDTRMAMQRRINVSNPGAPMRLAFLHSGLLRNALNVKVTSPTTGSPPTDTANAFLGNKLTLPPLAPLPSYVTAEQKIQMLIKHDAGEDIFPTPFADTVNIGSGGTGNLIDQLTMKYSGAGTDHWQYVPQMNAPNAAFNPLYAALPYWTLAGYGLRKTSTDTGLFGDVRTPDNGFGWRQDIKDPLPAAGMPLATSIAFNLNGADAPAWRYDDNTNTYTPDSPINPGLTQFGFNAKSYNDGDVATLSDAEDATTVDRSFYSASDANGYTLDSRLFTAAQAQNSFAMQLAPTLQPLDGQFEAAADYEKPAMPAYRLSRLKLEADSVQANGLMTVNPVTFDVRAFVYAQEGSWVVLPGNYFTPLEDGNLATANLAKLKPIPVASATSGYFFDFNGDGNADANEYALGAGGKSFPDLNRNGEAEADEEPEYLLMRFLRYNDKVQFTGAIMENQPALVQDVVDVTDPLNPKVIFPGAVQRWTDAWAWNSRANIPGGGLPKYGSVSYSFDPDIVNDTQGNFLNDPGFQYPMSSDIAYQD